MPGAWATRVRDECLGRDLNEQEDGPLGPDPDDAQAVEHVDIQRSFGDVDLEVRIQVGDDGQARGHREANHCPQELDVVHGPQVRVQ